MFWDWIYVFLDEMINACDLAISALCLGFSLSIASLDFVCLCKMIALPASILLTQYFLVRL